MTKHLAWLLLRCQAIHKPTTTTSTPSINILVRDPQEAIHSRCKIHA